MGSWLELKTWSREALQMVLKPYKNVIEVSHAEVIKCKYCERATHVVRYGTSKGRQVYFCQKCNRKFLDNKAKPGGKVPIEAIGTAISLYYSGMSLSDIGRQLWQLYRTHPARPTIYRWIIKYSKEADKLVSGLKPKVGKTWVVDETSVKVGGKNLWLWDAIDADTRYLIASHLSTTRTSKDAETLMRRAQSKTDKPPKFIISDKLAAYIEGIEKVYGSDTWHLKSEGFTGEINTNLIERMHGTIKGRTKVMRGLKDKKTAEAILNGFLLYYNVLRPHQSLNGKTPAEAAGIKFPYNNWAEIVKGNKKE